MFLHEAFKYLHILRYKYMEVKIMVEVLFLK